MRRTTKPRPTAGDVDQAVTMHAQALGVPVAVLAPALGRRRVCRRGSGVCRVCRCTNVDCRRCVELTGEPCHWVEPDLCSACTGWARIVRERVRQREVEGFTAQHDAVKESRRQLRRAAECYSTPPAFRRMMCVDLELVPKGWPWAARWWKPSKDWSRDLEKAGALYLAESDRLLERSMKATAIKMVAKAKACGREIDNLTRVLARKKGRK